jgi:hypothetical protein
MTAADRIIRWTTAVAVIGFAAVAAVAAWPAVALVGSYELLMVIVRGAQQPPVASSGHDDGLPVWGNLDLCGVSDRHSGPGRVPNSTRYSISTARSVPRPTPGRSTRPATSAITCT